MLTNYMLINTPDAVLLVAVYNNDEKAFNLLFERHWSKVYTAIFKYVKDQEACLELTHDIFVNIWNKRHTLHIKSFKNYVITAGSYHGIRKRQSLKASQLMYIEDYEYTENMEYSYNHHADFNEGEISIDLCELNIEIDTLLNDLPKRCREIYTMSRKENLSISEIAERLNISKRTVENQLTCALKHLRTSLKYAGLILIFNLFY